MRERVDKYKSAPLFQPIVVKDDLSYKEVAKIEARKHELPELIIQLESKRNYPYGTFASHVFGYLQEISPTEMEMDQYRERRLGDLVGKTGIEKQYEHILVGTEGQSLQIVDSIGREIEEISRTDANGCQKGDRHHHRVGPEHRRPLGRRAELEPSIQGNEYRADNRACHPPMGRLSKNSHIRRGERRPREFADDPCA